MITVTGILFWNRLDNFHQLYFEFLCNDRAHKLAWAHLRPIRKKAMRLRKKRVSEIIKREFGRDLIVRVLEPTREVPM